MEHYDNEQRLRILQERLNQIKDKQTSNSETDRDNDNNPPYPTYNPKATESSDVDINLPNTHNKQKSRLSAKPIILIILFGFLLYGLFYLYEYPNQIASKVDLNMDKVLEEPKKEIINSKENIVIEYSLDFGKAKFIIKIGDYEDEMEAKSLVKQKIKEGYNSSHFFLPNVSNSSKEIYNVYLGPYYSEAEAKQWANTLDIEYEIINL